MIKHTGTLPDTHGRNPHDELALRDDLVAVLCAVQPLLTAAKDYATGLWLGGELRGELSDEDTGAAIAALRARAEKAPLKAVG